MTSREVVLIDAMLQKWSNHKQVSATQIKRKTVEQLIRKILAESNMETVGTHNLFVYFFLTGVWIRPWTLSAKQVQVNWMIYLSFVISII